MLDAEELILISVDDHIIEPRSARVRTPDGKLDEFRKRPRRAVAAAS